MFGTENHLAAQLVQIPLGASVPLVLLAIGREMGQERAGWFAAWVGALHVNLILWSGFVLQENLSIPLLVFTFYLLLRIRRRDSANSLILTGLSMGVLLLIRPTVLPFPTLVPIWFSWTRWTSGWRVARPLCVLLLSTALVLVPWTARNYVVFKRFVPISTGDAIAFWYGTQWDELNRAGWMISPPIPGMQDLDEFKAREMYIDGFVSYVKSDPRRYVSPALRKAVSFWSLYFPQYSFRHKAVNIIFFVPIFALSIVGLLFARADRKDVLLFWMLLVSTTLLHMLTLVDYDGRYRLPIEPFLCVTAGMGLFRLLDVVRPRHAAETV